MLLYALQPRHGRCIWKSSTKTLASRSHFFQTQINESKQLRILFMGRDEFSCLVLQELYQARDVWSEIVIATQPDVHTGRRGSILSVSPLKILGEELKIPVHTIPKIKKDFRHWPLPSPFIASAPHDHMLVTASFGRILSEKMLSAFPPSHRLNVHPSLLPAYRGPAPMQHMIMNGEKETGVCIIQMLKKSEGIDAGALWGCHKMSVPENSTFPSLREELGRAGGTLLVSVIRDMLSNKAAAAPQPPADNAPRAPFITATDALVDFSSMTAEQIYSRFRAINHQRSLFTHTPDATPVRLVDMVVIDPSKLDKGALFFEPGWTAFTKPSNMLLIRCAAGSVLGVTKVKPEGRPDRLAGEFWNGLRNLQLKDGAKHLYLGRTEST